MGCSLFPPIFNRVIILPSIQNKHTNKMPCVMGRSKLIVRPLCMAAIFNSKLNQYVRDRNDRNSDFVYQFIAVANILKSTNIKSHTCASDFSVTLRGRRQPYPSAWISCPIVTLFFHISPHFRPYCPCSKIISRFRLS